jgi:hypothetical protein
MMGYRIALHPVCEFPHLWYRPYNLSPLGEGSRALELAEEFLKTIFPSFLPASRDYTDSPTVSFSSFFIFFSFSTMLFAHALAFQSMNASSCSFITRI